ncbi:MAG: DUF2232 domain-containing protein [Pelovirga sp.]
MLTAVGTLMTLACVLGVVWLGPAAALLNVLTAVPAVYLGLRLGLRYGLALVAATVAFLLLLTSPYSVATYLALFGTGSLLLPFFLLLRIPWDRAALYTMAGALLLSGLLLLLFSMTGSVTPAALIERIVQAEAEQAMQIYRQSGFSDQQLQEIGAVISRLTTFVTTGFPGILVAVLVSIQTITLLVVRALTKNHVHIAGPAFVDWRLPARLIWLLIFSGFGAFSGIPILSWLGQNLLLVLLPLYFLQGMAVISSYLQRRPWPAAIKGLIYLALVILSPLPLVVTSIGVFDLWIDFRKNRLEKLT